jgi:hypothetical protein
MKTQTEFRKSQLHTKVFQTGDESNPRVYTILSTEPFTARLQAHLLPALEAWLEVAQPKFTANPAGSVCEQDTLRIAGAHVAIIFHRANSGQWLDQPIVYSKVTIQDLGSGAIWWVEIRGATASQPLKELPLREYIARAQERRAEGGN